MYVAWVIFLPIGVLYPLLWKEAFRSNTKWLNKHTSYQGNGFSLALVGALVAIGAVSSQGASLHAKIGLSTIAIATLHVLLAIMRPRKVDQETREENPNGGLWRDMWVLWHRLCGYITILLAWINVYLGFSKIITDYNLQGGTLYVIYILEISALVAYTFFALFIVFLQFAGQKAVPSEVVQDQDSI